MIHIFSTGGTIDKVYFDAISEFDTGEAQANRVLAEGNVVKAYTVTEICRKDSLDISQEDRFTLIEAITNVSGEQVVVTHGTDTLVETAESIASAITDKTVVLVGAMQPALMRLSDAPFNLGFAFAAVQLLPKGVYLAMNGQVFSYDQVCKNRDKGCFEPKM